jgi:hypothetical protein
MKQVEFVSDEMGDKGVAELERLATALFVANREGIADVERRAERLVELKPHISSTDAFSASEQVDRLIRKSRPFRVHDESIAS